MISLLFDPYQDKITDFYFRKEWQENIVAINGTPNVRTLPWLDASFYLRLDKWMEKEYGVDYRRFIGDTDYIYFANEEDATRFVLRWS